LVEIWLGFLIKHGGQWTPEEEMGLRRWAEYGQAVTDREFEVARLAALEIWRSPGRQLILCCGSMCSPKRPRPGLQLLEELGERLGCRVRISDCQNRCSRAPSATMLDRGDQGVRMEERRNVEVG
jgi:hypothetical protein